jgi:hypothetical protein
MVHERTKDRYAGLREAGDDDAAEKLMRLTGTEANVSGILHWLDKTAQPSQAGRRVSG